MKRAFSLLSKILTAVTIILLVVELILRANMNQANSLDGSISPASGDQVEAHVSFEKFAVDQSQNIDVMVNQTSLARLSPREQVEQARDWLLFTIVANSGLSKNAINKVTFDLPTFRYNYLAPTTRFQFGVLRSLYIGNGQVVALIPADALGDLRIDYLARIADDQRKGTGNIPKTLFVFEYSVASDLSYASVTQRASIQGSDLFTETSGYYEMLVSSAMDLTKFMETIDNVTAAKITTEGLVLGGRKLKALHYQNISLEDIAALWQADKGIRQQWDILDAKWQTRINSYNQRCASASPSDSSNPTSGMTCSEEKQAIEQGRDAEYQSLSENNKLINGTGFSLDPTYDYEGLKQIFEEHPELINNEVLTLNDISDSLDGLNKADVIPLLQMIEKLKKSYNQQTAQLGEELSFKVRYQYSFNQARYDGNLQGTEVGMTLFYTDLLAKLWVIDLEESAPVDKIMEFVPPTNSPTSIVYEGDVNRLPNTRLWFGPEKDGFQLAGDRYNLVLGRKTTRVYAASSNPLQPGKEETPNEPNFVFLNWWNNHYDEIAEFEPQYQRLDQIMKWSLIISWLDDSKHSDNLSYLNDVTVTRSNWFPDWVNLHSELRFDKWDAVKVFPRGSYGTQTEVVPVLSSRTFKMFGQDNWTISGGVSLADIDTFTNLEPLIPSVENDLVLRAGLDLKAGVTKDSLVTLEKTQIKFLPETAIESGMIAIPDELALYRHIDGDLGAAQLMRTMKLRNEDIGLGEVTSALIVDTRIGANDLGTLNIKSNTNGFEIGWIGRDVDTGQSIALRMSKSESPLNALQLIPNIKTVFDLPDGKKFLVRLKNSNNWMQTGIDDTGNASTQWTSHISDPVAGVHVVGINWESPGTVFDTASAGSELQFSASKENVLTISLNSSPTSAETIEIKIGETTIKGKIDPDTGEVFIPYAAIPKDISGSPERLENLVTANDLAKLQVQIAIAPDKPFTFISSESRLMDVIELDTKYRSENFSELAHQFASNPDDNSKTIAEHLRYGIEFVNQLVTNGEWAKANGVLDELASFHGSQPEINLWRAYIEIEQDRPEQAVEYLNNLVPKKGSDFITFNDEITSRLQSGQAANVIQSNEVRAAQTLEWKTLQSQGSLPVDGKVVAFNTEQKVSIEYHFTGDIIGVPFDPKLGIAPNKLVYVQDSPGLNNLDWSSSIDPSLQTVISGDFGTVVELPRGDIAHFKPDRVFNGDKVLFNNVTFKPEYLLPRLWLSPYMSVYSKTFKSTFAIRMILSYT